MVSRNSMLSLPLKPFAVSSLVISIFLVQILPRYSIQASYVKTTASIFGIDVLGWAIWAIILYPKFFSPIRHLPGPSDGSWWNGQWNRINRERNGQPMADWINSVPNDGLIRYLGLFNEERVLVTSPKALTEVLTTKTYEFVKPPQFLRFLARLLGVGVLLAEGDEHRRQRKNLSPAFAFRHVKDLYPIFWSTARELVRAISLQIEETPPSRDEKVHDKEKGDEGTVVEIAQWASRATLDIIGAAGMAKEFNAISDPTTELNTVYRTVFEPNRQARYLGLLSLFLPFWIVTRIPVKRNGDVDRAITFIRKTCKQLIMQKKEVIANKPEAEQGKDILSVALRSGGFSDENLIDQMMTFLAAGHETTSTALTLAIMLLCQNPEMQTRLRAEIRANLPSISDETPMTSTRLESVPYLTAFCNEALRLHPPVPITIRQVGVSATGGPVTILGSPIPKGTHIILAPSAVNVSKALWGPDALVFNPDRWLPDRPLANSGGAASTYSMLTFLHGPRGCIGREFARSEFACLVAALVGRFEFELADKEREIEFRGGLTAKPVGGLPVRVKVVEGW